MNFSQFLLILRARSKIIMLTLIVTVATALSVSLLLPKTYMATTSLVINYKGIDPVTGLTLPAQLMPGYMPTQVDIITSKSVAMRVVDELKMAEGAAVREQFQASTGGQGSIRDWLGDLLLKKLDVTPSRESNVLDISFKGSDPNFAAAVANSFANQYQLMSIHLKVEPLKKASVYFTDQIKLLRDNFEVAQNKLSQYQQENGIVSLDNRVDVELARLNDLSSQLVMAQGQAMEASSRQHVAKGRAAESPDVVANPLIQSLKVALTQAESKFSEIEQRLEKNHPQYQGAKAELDKLRSDLDGAIKATSNSVGNNAQILRQRESDIRAALAAQKTKVLELNRTRDELSVLVKDMESAQRAYEVTSQRFTQTNLEGQSNQSDIAVLNPAVAPITASGPKVFLNTVLSIFLGSMLGLGFGLLAEMLDRRVRSADDVGATLGLPVFGVMVLSPKNHRLGLSKWLRPRLQSN